VGGGEGAERSKRKENQCPRCRHLSQASAWMTTFTTGGGLSHPEQDKETLELVLVSTTASAIPHGRVVLMEGCFCSKAHSTPSATVPSGSPSLTYASTFNIVWCGMRKGSTVSIELPVMKILRGPPLKPPSAAAAFHPYGRF